MSDRTSKSGVLVALIALLALIAGSVALLVANSAQAQTVTDFNLSVTDGGLPAAGGSSDVTIAITPGGSAIAAVGALVSYDADSVEPTACVVLVGLGACNTDTAGEINVQTVDASGWATPTDLFRVSFTSIALTGSTPLDISVIDAYDVSGALIAGDIDDGELALRVNGDVNCNDSVTVADALFIAQFVVGNRTAVDTCPLADPASQINVTYADISNDGRITTLDALRAAQCAVGIFDCES